MRSECRPCLYPYVRVGAPGHANIVGQFPLAHLVTTWRWLCSQMRPQYVSIDVMSPFPPSESGGYISNLDVCFHHFRFQRSWEMWISYVIFYILFHDCFNTDVVFLSINYIKSELFLLGWPGFIMMPVVQAIGPSIPQFSMTVTRWC